MKSSFEKCIGTDKIDKQDLFDRASQRRDTQSQTTHTYHLWQHCCIYLLLLQKVQAALKDFITPAFQSLTHWTGILSSLQLNHKITIYNHLVTNLNITSNHKYLCIIDRVQCVLSAQTHSSCNEYSNEWVPGLSNTIFFQLPNQF